MMMLLFAVTGVMRAQSLTVHDGTTTNSYVPVYGYYADAYNKCEMVYPATELGEMAGAMINGMTFYASQASVAWGANFQVFMTEVADASISAFAGPGTVVYEGQLSISDNEMVVTFDTPYTYGGGNLLVGVYQTSTGSYITSTWYGETVTGASGSGYNYGDLASCTFGQRNFLPKTTFDYVAGGASAITVNPSTLDLGNRPNGAWMAPFTFNVENAGGAITVTGLEFDNNYFTAEAEMPASVYAGNPLEVEVTTGTTTAGPVSANLAVVYTGGDRNFEMFNITANAYDPVNGDVWENAIVAAMPYTDYAPTGIYKNYELPTATDGADAVYKVTFDEPVLFSAGTNGANAAAAIYNEDFEEVGGPAANNNYEYYGPEVGPGPISMWFGYNYTGSNTFFGTSAGGGMIFGYRITAEMLQELGLGNCAITTVEAAAREGSYYDLVILKGGDTPDLNNMVYYQAFDNYEPYYFFDVNLDEPQFLGDDENIWVMFYSDSPYAAYCGKQPVDAANSKIWYTTNLTNWYSNTTYTPVIYTRFLELPTGREVTVNLADMKIRESKPAAGELAEANGDVMGVVKAQIAKANRGNRDTQTLIEQGFEDGMGDWTMYNCDGNTGISSAAANTGDYCFRFYYTTNYPQYLISPELDDNNGGTMTFYARQYNSNWDESYKLGYSTTTNDVSAFTFGAEVTDLTALFAEKSFDFPAGTKYVCIACTSNDQFYMYVDDITITADITSGGGTPTVAYQIEDMYCPAGTYYVVVASSEDNFQVNMDAVDAPAPEQAMVWYPFDGETGVEFPYLAEWTLGDYTEEFQVLLGTVYPPTTPIVNWTSDLVEAMFLPELEHNMTYFMQVNERNAMGTTYGEIVGFTTVIDGVEDFAVESAELYPGDDAVFTWTANRNLKGYNLYMFDGVDMTKVNDAPITGTTYTVSDLDYNTDPGYTFFLTAVYDEGESEPTDGITVYMTGTGFINGHVWEYDSITPVYNVAVEVVGIDEYGYEQVLTVGTTNPSGYYEGEILAGTWNAVGHKDGYQASQSEEITLAYTGTADDVDIILLEDWAPLGMIKATEEENDVLVEWSWNPASLIVDFETGDFSQAEFTLPASYPWAISTTNPYEGTYCMKSTCEGVASGSSIIEATVEVPYDGKMGFWVKVSSESNYDKFHFYIDGIEQGSALSGNLSYSYKEFDVAEGTHTYKWEYTKDSSVNSNDDCVYVDNITMYRLDQPLPPTPGAQVYDFEDSSLQGWTTLDADGDGYTWMVASELMSTGYGHNGSTDCVLSQSYSNTYGVLYPDNYLVSPTKIAAQAGASISFWACAQDASYAGEHFGVAISTGNATAADFTTIQEWTMTAKGPQGSTAENAQDLRGTRAQGSWYQYTVDLSSYAGQQIWVALRHFNCNDMFYLDVDDITLNDGSAKRVANNDRTLSSFKLYRRNINGFEANPDDAEAELIASPALDVFSYTDNAWNNLPYGMYQWGIQAKYEGNHHYPEKGREAFETQIGEGTSTFGYFPFYTLYNYSIAENLFLASELTDAGMGASEITSLSWYATNTTGYAQQGISIWMANVTDTELTATSHVVTDMTLVYTGSMTPLVGWNEFVFNEGTFNWDGTSNLLIFCQRNNGDWNSTISWQAGTVSFNASAYKYQDSGAFTVTSPNTSMNTSTNRPNIVFKGNASAGGGAGGDGFGFSEILWSNVIEKDMTSTVTFNVATDNNQSPAGAVIEMVGNETYTGELEDSSLVLEGVRKGDYHVTVTLAGYDVAEADLTIEENEVSYDVMLKEVLGEVADLYVSPTGWAMWDSFAGTTNNGNSTIGGSTGGGGGGGGTVTGETTFTEGFEGGLNGWTVLTVNTAGGEWLHSSDNPGGYDYTTLAHGGTGFAMCYSYVDYVGAYNTDSYLITPQKYDIVAGSTLNFYADNANDSYPENFSVCVATVDNPTAADFTQVWSGGAKGEGGNDMVRHIANRYENWRSHQIDLSAYAGQSVYIAFHDVNYDAYEIWIDDVELTDGSKGDRAALAYKVYLDDVLEGETTNMFWQHDVDGFEDGETHVTRIAPVYATGMGVETEYTWTYQSCSHFVGATGVTAVENEEGTAVEINWTMPEGGVTPPTGGDEFTVDFEGGLPEGWTVVDANNDGYTWCLTSAIPTTWTYYASLTLDWYHGGTNAICSGSYINGVGAITPDEYLVSPQVNITAGSTFSFYAAATDASYPADHFGVFVSDNGTSDWTMVNEWTLTSKGNGNGGRASRDGNGAKLGSWYEYTVDLTAYAGQKYIAIRHFNCNDQYIMCVDDLALTNGTKGNRDMWDVLATFNATSGYQYGVATDGENIYTSSWSASSTSMFYKYDMEGNFIEEFNISGSGQIRDLTYDGEYFYGVANASTVYCLDLANHTLVSSFSTSYGAMRGITYDTERDGFWVIGNWSGNLSLIDRTGAIQTTGPAPESASGLAYYKDPNGVEHVYCLNNGTNDVQDFIIGGTSITASVFNLNTVSGVTGSTGGAHVGVYDGKTCLFADLQQSPQLIAIIELDGEGGGVVPPVVVEGILGSVLLRDGEILAVFTGAEAGTNSYVDEGVEIGEHEYCVRVIYGGDPDVTLWAMSCPECAEVNYTGVVENDVVDNIYPNPTRSNVTIEAQGMNHITVVSALGQVVYDADVNADMIQLNLGQYKAGLYLIRVNTENGVSVKRVTVIE